MFSYLNFTSAKILSSGVKVVFVPVSFVAPRSSTFIFGVPRLVSYLSGLMTLAVADTGIGIPADQVASLGNPFVQIRSSAGASHEGTGLGLALVRALTEIHDGRLSIESAAGKGTTVSVVIPCAADDEMQAA